MTKKKKEKKKAKNQHSPLVLKPPQSVPNMLDGC